jgi:hypothetical protein
MRARGCQAEHHVARRDLAAIDDLGLFHRADREAGEIVFAIRVHARHLGSLAADQGAAGQFATAGDALDHIGRARHIQLAAGKVIEEEQRLGALHQDIVDAHRDQVDADGVMPLQVEGELELGADAVGAGNQHRLPVFLADFKQGAEAADAGEHAFPHRTLCKRLDGFDQGIAGVDIDAGITVRQGNIRRRSHGGDIAAEGGRITGFEPDDCIRKNRYFIKPPTAVAELMPFSFTATRHAMAAFSDAGPAAALASARRRAPARRQA